MGLFDRFKSKQQTPMSENRFTEANKEKAIDVLKNILHALHEKNYKDVISYVDISEIEDLENFLSEFVGETLELNSFDSIDEYGVECSFKPQYEYSQLDMDEYNDKSGFYLEYAMTSNGDLVDLALQLKFLYTENGLKSIFENINPQ